MIRKTIYAFSKRAFLNPASTHLNSYVEAHIQTGREGPDKWGDNMVTIADCKRVVQLEFFLGSKRDRRLSLAKIDLLIKMGAQLREQFRLASGSQLVSVRFQPQRGTKST